MKIIMATLVDYEHIFFIKGKLTTSDMLTKKETTRDLCSSIPALQAEKVSWLMDPAQATENTEGLRSFKIKILEQSH